jgi:hypothetical protein
MGTHGRAAITALLAGAMLGSLVVDSIAGPFPINTTMKAATGNQAVQVRGSGRSHRVWQWGPRAPIDGAIAGGAIAANAFGPFGYGYPYYPSYRCYGFWPVEECSVSFYWGRRR